MNKKIIPMLLLATTFLLFAVYPTSASADTATTLPASEPATIYYTTGVCGAVHSTTVTSAPTTNLCAVGAPSTRTDYGYRWDWSCAGVGGAPNANCYAKRGYPLQLTFAGTGGGSVNNSQLGIHCISGSTCPPVLVAVGTSVTIANSDANPDAFSSFGGWSGACSGTGNCLFKMPYSDQFVTANFIAVDKIMVGNTTFGILQTAYNDKATINGSLIKLLEGYLGNTLTANKRIAVEIEGGYSADFTAVGNGMNTTIQGPLRISAGTVRVKGVNVK